MNGKENPIELLVICAVMGGLSILGIIGGFSRRPLWHAWTAFCSWPYALMMGLISALLLLVLGKGQGWIGKKADNAGSTPAAAK